MKSIAMLIVDHGHTLWMACIAGVLLLPALGVATPAWLIACALAPLVLFPLIALLRS